jgi:hypothetical protein
MSLVSSSPAPATSRCPRVSARNRRTPPSRRSIRECFFVSCDLNPSTKLGKAAGLVPSGHQFEMSIEEQAAAMLTDGLSFADHRGLNVFATFAAFMEGIAREGFELWRYQRNLNGRNEGLNVVMHFSHVGACTGRDHFSGWSSELALGAHALPAPVLRACGRPGGVCRRQGCAAGPAAIAPFRATPCRSSPTQPAPPERR